MVRPVGQGWELQPHRMSPLQALELRLWIGRKGPGHWSLLQVRHHTCWSCQPLLTGHQAGGIASAEIYSPQDQHRGLRAVRPY